jgi:hypothetical protein
VIAVELESGCITAGEFVEKVRSRASNVREARAGEPARRVRVTVGGAERVVGRLVTAGEDGALVVREVEGATCQEVIDALALVLAVTLDPLTDATPTVASPPPADPPRPALVVVPEARRPPSRPRPVPPRRRAAEVRWHQLVGAEGTVSAGLVATPLAGLGARYALSREERGGSSLLLTVGAFATFAADAPANHPTGGAVRYRLQGLDASLCPLGARVHARVRLYPCGAVTVGRLQAEGIDLPGRRADAAVFAAAALEGRATLQVVGALELMGAAALSLPLGKYSAVVVGADNSAGEVQPVGIVLAMGVAARLP